MPRILIIDDDELFRNVVALTLRQHGHTLWEAGDGATGIQLAEKHLPDLIVSDVIMEGIDGFGVLAALRQNPSTACIPFILMTGMGDHTRLRQGMELGADDFLPKPFPPDQLLIAVDTRLKKHKTILQHAENRLATLRDNISISLPHEMLTPLQGILGAAEIILTETNQLPGEVVEMAQQIMESGNRLHRTIQHFLIYAQMELLAASPGQLGEMGKSAPLAVKKYIDAIAHSTASGAKREGDLGLQTIEAEVCIADDLLSKIVGELLDNAFKFSTAGTPVSLVSRTDGGWYRIEIQDAGCGMRPEELAQVGAFMQFKRRLVEQQGSGLGLIIARRLCEFHKGSLSLTSEAGKGTHALVILPLAQSAPAGSP